MGWLLHSLAATIMFFLYHFLGTLGVIIDISLCWFLRELCQANPNNIIAALRSTRTWSLHKHFEWIAPSITTLIMGVLYALR